jgi:hypothetical protein
MAADYCGHHGGQLAAVPSQQVQQAIVDQVKVQYSARMITSLWIGGMEDLGTESSRIWKWTTDGRYTRYIDKNMAIQYDDLLLKRPYWTNFEGKIIIIIIIIIKIYNK